MSKLANSFKWYGFGTILCATVTDAGHAITRYAQTIVALSAGIGSWIPGPQSFFQSCSYLRLTTHNHEDKNSLCCIQ